jgi:DNA-binding NarL/FixJ family response regulator
MAVLKEFRRLCPKTPAMVLTAYFQQSDSVAACVFGAQYVVKPISLSAIEAFVKSTDDAARPIGSVEAAAHIALEFELTPAEARVYALLTERLSTREISERLFVSRETVRTHVHRILAKVGAHSRGEAISVVLRRSVP